MLLLDYLKEELSFKDQKEVVGMFLIRGLKVRTAQCNV